MILDKKWDRWADDIRKNKNLPLRVELWNGRQINFGHGDPQVIIRIPHITALSTLFFPSIANIGKAYVEEQIELEGELHNIITIGNALLTDEPKSTNKFLTAIKHIQNNKEKNREAIQYHYDVSNDFYQLWLDKNMVYSCAYFENGDEDLESAQIKKIDHILNKIQLRSDQSLLDIGCGWGALVLRAAQTYGAKCVGITLSKNQEELARKRVFEAGLNDKIEIRLQDYRDVDGSFDRITSVGMFEHVGIANLPTYFSKIHSLLADNGIAMNHGITTTDIYNRETPYGEFIEKYVFPQGQLPHISTVLKSMQEGGLEALDIENLRRHYAETCLIWTNNFEAHTDEIKKIAGERRYRIWRIYLAGCAYAFKYDWISLYQVVCVKSGQNSELLPWSRRYMYPSVPIGTHRHPS
jgi:cyclopropane-fatty-acyl-phospholipid synthase